MATVKVKFRASTVPGKAGTIYYQLCHLGTGKQITTAFRIQPQQWDAGRGEIAASADSDPVLSGYRRRISYDLFLLRRIIRRMDDSGRRYTLADVVASFRNPGMQTTVLAFLTKRIEDLKQKRKWGTAGNYLRALHSFEAFLAGDDLPLGLLNEEVVMKYNDWLAKRKIERNSVSFYMRILRASYNEAVRQDLVEQTYPFRNVYTGVDRTRKRAIDENTILRLQQLDLRHTPALAFARDLFLFSFCTRGMAFVDVAFLRKSDVRDGAISYTRQKTGQRLTVRLEPCICRIIERYGHIDPESPYLFPILSAEDLQTAYKQYWTALSYYNLKLKRIGKMLGGELSLSSYTPRHSWATVARNRNIPLSVISAGMGHSSERTTQIYLDSLENSVIDRANHGIVKWLNKI